MESDKSVYLYDWLEDWYHICVSHRVRESTSRCYRNTIGIIHRWFADKLLSELGEMEILLTFTNMADKGCSKSALKKVKIVLHQAYTLAIRNHYVDQDPTLYVTIPQNAPEKDVLPLTVAEQQRVEQACIGDIHGDLIIFLLYTGLRLGEMCNLRWDDFDNDNKEIHIRKSKTAAGMRVVPLLPKSQAIIALQPKINDFIFNSQKSKNPITLSIMRKTYLRLRKKAMVSGLTNHVCRHTFATRLIERGASPAAVASLLGHTNVSFTLNRYVKAQPGFLREQISLLSSQGNFAIKDGRVG